MTTKQNKPIVDWREELEQSILTTLNLFAMAIDTDGYTPELHEAYTNRVLEDADQAVKEAVEAERKRLFEAIEKEYAWTLDVESTKNPMRLKVKSDYYIHINWKEWLRFKESISIMQERIKSK